MNDYVSKPIRADELAIVLARWEKALADQTVAAPKEFRAGRASHARRPRTRARDCGSGPREPHLTGEECL